MNTTTTSLQPRWHHRHIRAGHLACTLGLVLAIAAGSAIAAEAREEASIQAALTSGLRPTILQAGQAAPQWSLQDRMAHHRVPGVAIAVLRDGKLVH
ncbi:MAG TPA: hypothetical protein VLF15_00305, partial [Pseudoxanthomonas sp.]|nr:hypothetical protein [Pseudoxanthomonas sp.]